MALFLHNTLTRAREPFDAPADPQLVTMYVCGPTVYNYAHIGNVRPPVVFDVLARLLRRSYTLTYARNVTDVDDKINDAARREGVAIGVLTARYLAAYHEDMRVLGVAPPDIEPRVTDNIAAASSGSSSGSLRRGMRTQPKATCCSPCRASPHTGNCLAATPKTCSPARASRSRRTSGMPATSCCGNRRMPDIVGWPSPWGRGRPGWHIECSAMVGGSISAKRSTFTAAASICVFPHHENEIAQSTCAHGGKHITRAIGCTTASCRSNGEKMSKSLGNVRLVRELLAEHGGETLRLALLTAHYRQPLDWTRAARRRGAAEARPHVRRAARGRYRRRSSPSRRPRVPPAGVLAALEDDFNTPRGRRRAVRRRARREQGDGLGREAARSRESLRAGGWLLGLLAQDPAAVVLASHATAGGGRRRGD